jgi:hypothetical protein
MCIVVGFSIAFEIPTEILLLMVMLIRMRELNLYCPKKHRRAF